MIAAEPKSWPAIWADRRCVAKTPYDPGLFLALAPMDGVTDATYRQLITEINGGTRGVSLCVSEFVRVTRDPVPAHVLLRYCPELRTGGMTSSGVPVFVQLLGGNPHPLARTAQTAVELGALGIDLNFGCPAKTVNNHDGGASLLKCPQRMTSIIQAVREAVPAHVPVSAKMRIGWASSDGIEELAQAVEAGGASWLTIHARTRVQLYKPPVQWSAIAQAKQAIRCLPIVANGDLRSLEDINNCAEISLCPAFMIGRGAMGSPYIFAQIRGFEDENVALENFLALLQDYFLRLCEHKMPVGMALCRVKQWLRMGSEMNPFLQPLFQQVKVLTEWQQMDEVFAQYTLSQTY